MDIGSKLKAYRQYRNLSQEALAYKAGLNEKYYGRIERNESCPTIDKLQKICGALEIDMTEIFLYGDTEHNTGYFFKQQITNIIIDGLKHNIDIHFNRDILTEGCSSCIWYHGYIGSMSFDEFELKIYAVGNVKGSLFKDGEEVLELNGEDVFNEMKKYIKNDNELNRIIEFMSFDEDVLKEKNGNVLFIQESNWLSAKLVNNKNDEIINSEIIFDADNILTVFSGQAVLLNSIFES